ncbi:MATE family efflux transporter [Paenibacillus dokdonensis]|uniref:MATE family efflux transporter n=1 Tax=Paenibacillus dokdonensis TaxID=2567944 RepID=UPI001FEC248F|nr:MATE family efflux transporter [Paenibacillus dokdonensis]
MVPKPLFPKDYYGKAGAVITLAAPAMTENILQTAVGFVDTLFVSKLGLQEVAAAGMANNIMVVYFGIFMALGVVTNALISRSLGSREDEKPQSIAVQSVLVACAAGLLLGCLTFLFSKPILILFGATGKMLTDANAYFRIVAIPSVLPALMIVLGSILRGTSDTKSPMKAGLWMNAIHILLDYLFIFGLWRFSGWGIVGAAWASVVARILGVVILILSVRKSVVSFPLAKLLQCKAIEILLLLKLSGPVVVERLLSRLGSVAYMGIVISIGTDVYAAHIIAANIETLAFMPGYGLGAAATTLVGYSIGQKNKQDAWIYGVLSTAIGAIMMSIVGILLFILLLPWFVLWFTTDPSTIHRVETALHIAAFSQPALAGTLVLAGALQGAGDTRSPMYSTFIGVWLIRFVGVYVLGSVLMMGIAGIWIAISADLFVRAIYLFFRFHRKLHMRSIKHEPSA